MKRFALSLLVIFLFSPFFAWAQVSAEVAKGYCPDREKDFFKGSIYHTENGKPWIEVMVDPEFEAEMVKKRNLTAPLPLTPVYNLVVRIKPEFNYYCIPEWAGSNKKVTRNDLPGIADISASVVVGRNDEVITPPIFFYSTNETDEQERFIYKVKIDGWSAGIGAHSGGNERLIAAIQNGEEVNILLKIKQSDGTTRAIHSPMPALSLCAPLSGGSPHGIVYMRGKSAGIQVSQMKAIGDTIRVEGFEDTQPFKKYSLENENPERKRYFAHFADLANHDDTGWSMLFKTFFLANSRPRAISSCGKGASQYFFYTGRLPSSDKGILNYAPFGNNIAFLHSDLLSVTEVAMHEMGHSFAGLEDEYRSGFDLTLYHANCSPASIRSFSDTLKLVGRSVGDKERASAQTKFNELLKKVDSAPRNSDLTFLKRAYWDPYGNTIKGCSTNVQYRPSLQSIMNSGGLSSDKFNIPSCVWALKVIKGTSSLLDWQECMSMDGLEKPTYWRGENISFSLPSFFNEWFGRLVAAVVLTDTIGSANEDADFVNLEYFSRDGKEISNEVYKRTSGTGEDAQWEQVKGEATDVVALSVPQESFRIFESTEPKQAEFVEGTKTTPPSTDNLGVNAESIFDTISLNLKVNGQDGPVRVAPGNRIVVSWISEGATRCRANWSRNDIKLAGTAAGRLSRSVTIRAACINAEGERADDAVQVLVDTESS